jgi:hypothetical protein
MYPVNKIKIYITVQLPFYGTMQRTSSVPLLRPVHIRLTERCLVGWLQAVIQGRTFCVAVHLPNKILFFTGYSYNTTALSKTRVIPSQGHEIPHSAQKCKSEEALNGL